MSYVISFISLRWISLCLFLMAPWAYTTASWSFFVIENYSSASISYPVQTLQGQLAAYGAWTGWVGEVWSALPVHSSPFHGLTSWSRKERVPCSGISPFLFLLRKMLLGREAKRMDGQIKIWKEIVLYGDILWSSCLPPVASTCVASIAQVTLGLSWCSGRLWCQPLL